MTRSPSLVLRLTAVALASTLVGCGGKKPDVLVQPHVTWLFAHSQPIAPEKFQDETAKLFAPFRDDKTCGPREVFPTVDATWGSAGNPVVAPVVAIDPSKLATSKLNIIQKYLHKKPSFAQLQKMWDEQIRKDSLSEALAKDGLQFRGSSDLVIATKAKQSFDLVALRESDSGRAQAAARQLGGTASAAGGVAIVGSGPEQLRAAIIKSICASAASKDAPKLLEVLVVDSMPMPMTSGSVAPDPGSLPPQIGLAPSDTDTHTARQAADEALKKREGHSAEVNANRATANDLIKSAIGKMAQNDLAGADKDLAQARDRDPAQSLVYYNIGVLRLRQNRTDEALRAFEDCFKAGFKRFDLLPSQADLAGIRNDGRFQDLVRRYQKSATQGYD